MLYTNFCRQCYKSSILFRVSKILCSKIECNFSVLCFGRIKWYHNYTIPNGIYAITFALNHFAFMGMRAVRRKQYLVNMKTLCTLLVCCLRKRHKVTSVNINTHPRAIRDRKTCLFSKFKLLLAPFRVGHLPFGDFV